MEYIRDSLAIFGLFVMVLIIGAIVITFIRTLIEIIKNYVWMKWRRAHPPMPKCRCEFCKFHDNEKRCHRWDTTGNFIRYTPNEGFCYLGEYNKEKEIKRENKNA